LAELVVAAFGLEAAWAVVLVGVPEAAFWLLMFCAWLEAPVTRANAAVALSMAIENLFFFMWIS
jgi:hypothetical protein